MRTSAAACAALWLAAAPGVAAAAPPDDAVGPVPEEVRRFFSLGPFYEKHLDAGGMPILASGRVDARALLEARFVVRGMVGSRTEILAALGRAKVRLAVMAVTEFTTDIPEHADLDPREYWNHRARGLGATDARQAVSCAEENLLGLRGDPYEGESILVHEFAHTIHGMALARIDPGFDARLTAAFEAATRQGLWKGTYAASNAGEYWAEGVQSWFGTNHENDGIHNHVNTRAELVEYDAALGALCRRVFGDNPWRYLRPRDRVPPSPHFAGLDPSKAPSFSWAVLDDRERAGRPPPKTVAVHLLPPDARKDWRSAGSARPTEFLFVNRTARKVNLSWMDFEGAAKPWVVLEPGAQAPQGTYVGHVFRAETGEGTVLGYFVAVEEIGRAVLE